MAFTKTESAVLTVGGLCRQILSGDGSAGSGSTEGPALSFAYTNALPNANIDAWRYGEWTVANNDYMQMGDSTCFYTSAGIAAIPGTTHQPPDVALAGSRVAFMYMAVSAASGTDPTTNNVSVKIPLAATPHGGWTPLAVSVPADGTAAILGVGDVLFRTFAQPQNQLQTTIGDRIDFVLANTVSVTIKVAIGYRKNAYTP